MNSTLPTTSIINHSIINNSTIFLVVKETACISEEYITCIFGVKEETKQEVNRSREEVPVKCQALSELQDVTT
jgi:hypothetical protein